MTLLKIAARNILRNVRRSAMTMAAIAVGAVAMLVFGSFMAFVVIGYRTGVVESVGHLAVFKSGYIEVGSGNPGGYGIADYDRVMKLMRDDPVVGPRTAIITPTVTLYGLAGNYVVDTSKTFLGIGVIPSDHARMALWNEYNLRYPGRPPLDLADDAPTRGVIGYGLARILGLCAPLHVPNCHALPSAKKGGSSDQAHAAAAPPRLDLLAATAGGAPSVVAMTVAQAQNQAVKELDDSLVMMHLALAQQLLFGTGEKKVTSLVLQLHHTDDIGTVRARLMAIFKDNNLPLEIRDYSQLTPQYNETVGLFGAIFAFIVVVMGVIVLFTVINTMSMSVIERTNEIGTTRALGVRRAGIRREFLLEGALLGFIGATVGVALAAAVCALINHSGLTWNPPGQTTPIPFRVLFTGFPAMIVATWLGLILVATIAALIPADRAARMPVVDALRHI
jgi:putative ABC transport system permease protein